MELSDAEVLARCPLFAELPISDIEALAAVAHRKVHAAGEELFLAGESAQSLAVVVTGRVLVYLISPATGREVVLTVEHPHNSIAELVSLDGGTYPANARAVVESQLLHLDQARLEGVLLERPKLALHLLRTVGRRLRRLVSLVEQISFKEVVQRLAADILASSAAGLPVVLGTNSEIAGRIGTVPELVSRNLARLHMSGAIRLEGRQVLEIDRQQLVEMAESATR
ncbi:MAG: Crp/Fnr family transcriptional regulator [Trueperaceae bacterium]|nr:Crp/Fnr family transcriptional regulator [Trueperaceae bacterium]